MLSILELRLVDSKSAVGQTRELRLKDRERMARLITAAFVLGLLLICSERISAQTAKSTPPTGSGNQFLISPPKGSAPIIVRARFVLNDVNEINEGTETFEFVGVLTLVWNDPRQAFDPAAVGVNEKVYQGAYQVNEVSTGWFPQVVLVNEAGLYQKSGSVLRIKPDGTSTLVETVNAIAESEVDMTRFPFDKHRLQAVFQVLNFNKDEVQLAFEPFNASSRPSARLPQWLIRSISASIEDRPSASAGRQELSSTLVMSVDVERKPFYAMRLVVFPLMVIVLLSFSVFWMDRSSLGDRISVSFIGVLTGVAYLLVTSDELPHISYVTLMHGFVNLSFLTMCATVVINLLVGTMDKRGDFDRGNRIDRRCRWIFPSVYFGLLLVMFGVAILFY